MLTLPQDLTLLVRRPLVSAEQLAEAQSLSARTGLSVADALIKLGYVSEVQLLDFLGRLFGLEVIDLEGVEMPPSIIELIPESVARENMVLPLVMDAGTLMIITCDPLNHELREKLHFILNRNITFVLATRDQILDAINRHYGEADEQSCDEMLGEFTDTAIDFSETESHVDSGECDYSASQSVDCMADDMIPASASVHDQISAFSLVERRATVRYYDRMNPERLFPLLVAITNAAIRDAVQKGVRQARSDSFAVAQDSVVEVEPILPGCQVYPACAQIVIGPGDNTVKFHVVPHVLGRLEHARVVVRQQGRVLAEVPLEVRVAKHALAVLMGVLSFVAPLVSMVFKHFKIDFQAQLGLFAFVGQWLLGLPTELLAVPFLISAGALYLAVRPRQRDVFWEIQPVASPAPAKPQPATPSSRSVPAQLGTQGALLALAEKHYQEQSYVAALPLFKQALLLGRARAEAYHHASLTAAALGDSRQALAFLQIAQARLPRMPGGMLFNMACFATRLGEFAEAIRYAHRAINAGYRQIGKYRNDPDLAPLRHRGEFRQVLAALERA